VTYAPIATTVTPSSGTLSLSATGATLTPASVALSGARVAAQAAVTIAPSPMTITLTSPGLNPLDPNNYTALGAVTLTNTAAPGGSQVSVTSVAVAPSTPLLGPYFSNGPLAGPDTCTGNALAPGQSCSVGVRYTDPPTSARSVAAEGTATVSGGKVTAVAVTAGGSGYTYTPTVTFIPGGLGGSGATAHAVVTGGVVTSIVVDNPGSGYTTAPVVLVDAAVLTTGTITFTDTAVGGSQVGILWGIATP
jgi:hypothetical protein